MKKLFAILFVSFCIWGTCVAEDYGDIVVYEVPSYMESQAKDFMRSVSAQDKALYRSFNGFCIIIKSKGYGLDMYEYKLMNDYVKYIIPMTSYDYYSWENKL